MPETPESIHEKYLRMAQVDFLKYIAGLRIASGRGPKVFSRVIAPFQQDCFNQLAPNLEALRDGNMPARRRHWIERTKKAAKDSDLGAIISWLVAFMKRPFMGQVGAADRDQASIVKKRIDDLIYYNPWLNDFMQVNNYKIVNKAGLGEIEIVAADIHGSHGETPDLLVLNELSHVIKWEFIQNLIDNADGVPQGMILVATNAGFIGSEPYKLRQICEESPMWDFHIKQGPAPWHDAEVIAEARRRNSPSRFRRLWNPGEWISGKGDALDEGDISACLGKRKGPLNGPQRGWVYIAGMDLGISHDHAAVFVLGVHAPDQALRVAYFRSFEPIEGIGEDGSAEVNLQAVEDSLLSLNSTFRLEWAGYDPYQAKLMAQRLRRRGVPMREVTFTPANLTAMANAIKQVFEHQMLEAYDDEEGRLRRDLGKFNIVEKSYGYRLEATSDESGHADVGTAMVITLPKALELLGNDVRLQSDDDLLMSGDDDDLSADEIDALPDDLKAIFEIDDEWSR